MPCILEHKIDGQSGWGINPGYSSAIRFMCGALRDFYRSFFRPLQSILVTGFVHLGDARLQGQLWLWECDSLGWVLSFFRWQTHTLFLSNPMQNAQCNPIFLEIYSWFLIVIISVQLQSQPGLLEAHFYVISCHADNHYESLCGRYKIYFTGFRPKETTREFSSFFLQRI